MTEFLNALGPFIYGFALGYLFHPVWVGVKKIISEAKKAREEW